MISHGGLVIDSQRPHRPLPQLDSDRLARLTAFARRFRDVLLRVDQRARLEAYLRGLLDGTEPKNAEAIARRWGGDAGANGIAQSLQHFLSSSPWDIGRFLARYRSQFDDARGDHLRLWVIREVIFPKKGRHSVGVQRQLARPIGRKINCQVALAVSEVRPDGFFPLALRLYLPGYWLRESGDRVERLVPAEHREHRSKSDLAIQLLDELRDEGSTVNVLTAEDGFLSNQDFIEAIAEREMQLLRPGEGGSSPGDLPSGRREDWEVALQEKRGERASALARSSLGEVGRGFDWLKGHLGLGQFEGRNWLGWHHHAALVLAAYGFLVSEHRDAAGPPFSLRSCEGSVT